MKWKEKDDLSWCCLCWRRNHNDDNTGKQTSRVVLMPRSAEKEEQQQRDVSLSVKKVKLKKCDKRERKKKKRRKNRIRDLYFISCICISFFFFSLLTFFDYGNSSSPLGLSTTYSLGSQGLQRSLTIN